jgi:uncharacterized protein YdeI (YjbR/CyaY-like superfamily)
MMLSCCLQEGIEESSPLNGHSPTSLPACSWKKKNQIHMIKTEHFDSINDSSKRFVLRWIKLAKTEKTRNKRIQQIAQLSAQGKKLPGS